MIGLSKLQRRTVIPAVLAMAGVLVSGGPASAETTAVSYECKTWYMGEMIPVNWWELDYDVQAPETVAPHERFSISLEQGPVYAAPQHNEEIRNLMVAYRLPTGAELLDYELVGGDNLGSSEQTVMWLGNQLLLKASGPLPGGEEFTLPTLELEMEAPGGGTLTTEPGGSSFGIPAFKWDRLHAESEEWDPFLCRTDGEFEFSTTEVRN